MIIVGGSLATLNADILLKRFPELLVPTGPGERTIADLAALWHGEIARMMFGLSRRLSLGILVS